MDYFEASHDGYAPMTHRRHALAIHGDLLVVADLVTGSGTHETMVHWHIDPQWKVSVCGARAAFTRPGAHVDLTIAEGMLEAFSGSTQGAWLGWHAPVYGRVEPASTVRIGLNGPAPTWILSVFGLDADNPVRSVELVPVTVLKTLEHPLAVRVSRAQSTDVLVIAGSTRLSAVENQHPAGAASDGPAWRVAGLESDAQVLFARTAPGSVYPAVVIVPAAEHRSAPFSKPPKPGRSSVLVGTFGNSQSCAD